MTPNWHFLSRSIWDYLTFYLAFCLAFYLIYILTFDLTFYLTLRLHSIISCGLFDTYSPIFFYIWADIWLVVSTRLKNIKVNGKDYPIYIHILWKKCLKPPTRHFMWNSDIWRLGLWIPPLLASVVVKSPFFHNDSPIAAVFFGGERVDVGENDTSSNLVPSGNLT